MFYIYRSLFYAFQYNSQDIIPLHPYDYVRLCIDVRNGIRRIDRIDRLLLTLSSTDDFFHNHRTFVYAQLPCFGSGRETT